MFCFTLFPDIYCFSSIPSLWYLVNRIAMKMSMLANYFYKEDYYYLVGGAPFASLAGPGLNPCISCSESAMAIIWGNSFLLLPFQAPLFQGKCKVLHWRQKKNNLNSSSIAISFNLKICLVSDPVERARPLNFHECTVTTSYHM